MDVRTDLPCPVGRRPAQVACNEGTRRPPAERTTPVGGASRVLGTHMPPRARGKFLFAGEQKLYVHGTTYGTFRPGPDWQQGSLSARSVGLAMGTVSSELRPGDLSERREVRKLELEGA